MACSSAACFCLSARVKRGGEEGDILLALPEGDCINLGYPKDRVFGSLSKGDRVSRRGCVFPWNLWEPQLIVEVCEVGAWRTSWDKSAWKRELMKMIWRQRSRLKKTTSRLRKSSKPLQFKFEVFPCLSRQQWFTRNSSRVTTGGWFTSCLIKVLLSFFSVRWEIFSL